MKVKPRSHVDLIMLLRHVLNEQSLDCPPADASIGNPFHSTELDHLVESVHDREAAIWRSVNEIVADMEEVPRHAEQEVFDVIAGVDVVGDHAVRALAEAFCLLCRRFSRIRVFRFDRTEDCFVGVVSIGMDQFGESTRVSLANPYARFTCIETAGTAAARAFAFRPTPDSRTYPTRNSFGFDPDCELLEKIPAQQWGVVPILEDGILKGQIAVDRGEGDLPIDPEDVEFLDQVASLFNAT